MKYGVAYFHDPFKPHESKVTFCTESESGELGAWGQLLKERAWFTNIDLPAFIEHGLLEIPHLRHANYLAPGFRQILAEMGANIKGQVELQSLRLLLEIFSRVMNYASKSSHCDLEAVYENKGDSISAVLRYKHGDWDEELDIPDLVKDAFKDGYLMSTRNTQHNITFDDKITHLSFPRAAYAMALLNSEIPIGEWSIHEEAGAFKNISGHDILPVLEQVFAARSGMVKVKLPKALNEDLPLHRLNNANGQWLTIQEAEVIAKTAPLKVVSLAYAKERTTLNKLLEDQKWREPNTMDALSYSAGLYLQELWSALSHERQSTISQRSYTPSTATFIKSWDRVYCLRAAEAIEERGFKVLAYGNNNISIAAPKEEIQELLLLGYQLGICSMNMTQSSAFLSKTDNENNLRSGPSK